ncbi:MAG: alpha/beta hydrolase, partial [Dehalococcoidia bacterium]
MEPRIQYAQTKDGVSIAFWTMGEGMPFVVTPPLGWSHIQMELQNPLERTWFERLAERRRLVRYDGRGCGLSARDVTDFSPESFLLDLEAVVDRLGLERFVL